jgi:hypothetical protein
MHLFPGIRKFFSAITTDLVRPLLNGKHAANVPVYGIRTKT